MKITRFRDIPQFTRSGSYQCNYNMDGVWDWINKQAEELGGVDLDPDFQRSHVWTEQQQIAWLEFFLRGGRTGRVIYFNHPGWMKGFDGTLTLIDGKQRLQAIKRFMDDEILVFGSKYSEYTDRVDFVRHNIEICVNDLKTRKEEIQWYIDMNAGGTPHTNKEIEKARAILAEETHG
jgi:hypothetical protein